MANWIGVITNGGNDLLNEWVSQRELRFDSAAAGTGTVAVASMMAQTQLVSRKQEASIIGADRVDGGVRLKLRVTAHETGYTLNQYGVWASLTGGDSILIALFQHEQGIQVPSKSESQDFVYTFYALIGCSNTGTWTVNIDTGAAVSGEEMERAITEATNGLQPKITASGLLKGDGKGNITAAAGGTDYAWPTISGSGAPTEATKGETMQRYYDTSAEKEYVCTGQGNDGKYVWKLAGTGNEVSAHASNHATGGSDPITPSDIGAMAAAGNTKIIEQSQSGSSEVGWYRVLCSNRNTGANTALVNLRHNYTHNTPCSIMALVVMDAYAPKIIVLESSFKIGNVSVSKLRLSKDEDSNVYLDYYYGMSDANTVIISAVNMCAYGEITLMGFASVEDTPAGETVLVTQNLRNIPNGILPIATTVAVTLSASAWDSSAKTQTITVSGVLADETKQLITPTPALASQTAYYEAVVLCTGQAADQLTFTAKKIPTDDLTVYVTIQEVGA